ncbi:hypothetical protein COO60DRAFT_488362 [Scenedesmus sp. NREL 46B-D3]|nr:hypothetical protein COO60DRAFT_488362 [Scenedesmus sp. NREL 46B-D3]
MDEQQQQQQQQQPRELQQRASAIRPHISQYRSQSLPRLNSGAIGNGSSSNSSGYTHGYSNAAAAGAGGAAAAAAGLAAPAELGGRFQRATRTVGDCLALVKGLSPEVNSARSFREKCNNLLGAAIAASLALQEALSSSYKASGSELSLQHLASEVQSRLLAADALVRKYGHERLLSSLLRLEGREEVEKKFDGTIRELQSVTSKTWDLIDPDNSIKREVVMQGPAASSSVKTGNAFARHSLRVASQHKVQALLAFPDEDGEGHDGVVAWAAHRNIKLVNLSSQVSTVVEGAGEYLQCMAHDSRGYLWSGHVDGTVRIWSLEQAKAAGTPARIADSIVTAVALDPDTGYCWAGTAAGQVVVVRFNQAGDGFGRLELVRHLLGYDAHSPTARSTDSGGSYASSSRPMTVSSSTHVNTISSSSAAGSRHKPRPRAHHSCKPLECHPLGDAAAGNVTGLDLLQSCLGSQAPGSAKVKDACVHAGPVSCILISAGRAYTAGGSSAASAALLVWDSSRFELLRATSKRSTRWCRHPTTAMSAVYWAGSGPLRRGSSLAPAASLPVNFDSRPRDSSHSSGSTILSSGATGAPRSCSERQLITGHTNGAVIMWDTSDDTLRPVLLVGPTIGGPKRAVRSVVVLEELGILAVGHANGKVYMRKLDPRARRAPRDDANVDTWNPATFSLQVHRLGLQQMVGWGHLMVTTGKTGSVKLWPETQLRCTASEAGEQQHLVHRACDLLPYTARNAPILCGA